MSSVKTFHKNKLMMMMMMMMIIIIIIIIIIITAIIYEFLLNRHMNENLM